MKCGVIISLKNPVKLNLSIFKGAFDDFLYQYKGVVFLGGLKPFIDVF
jgi:hypothetical protein